ncbi:MAG: hypothetical protein KJO54_02670 [Gammaproteobacteria bacterium]|nr:hypothetical protein [Gammaproteobacteria bacterium]NNM20413.1 hypothetical protein [Gammaproteobacteria bacterium]
MKGFVEWLVARRYRMVLAATALALLPPLGIVAQGVVVLAVLMRGLGEGILIAVLASVLMLIPAAATGAALEPLLLVAAANWLPALLLAAVLERSRSLSLTTQTGLVAICALVILFYAIGSPAESWYGILQQYVAAMGQRIGNVPDEVLVASSRIMTGIVGALTLLSSVAAVYIARWWQSLMTRPGAFGEEFRALRMGWVLGVVAGVVFIAAAVTRFALLENLTLVLVSGFMLHGLAVMHSISIAGLGSFWLAAVYILLIVAMPFAELALAGLGFVDNWFNLRARLPRR